MSHLNLGNRKQSKFRERVRNSQVPVLIHTLIPPAKTASPQSIRRRLEHLEKLQSLAVLDAINIPEVRNESRKPRVTPFEAKWEPREFAQFILAETSYAPEIIIDRNVVYTNWSNQQLWLLKTTHHFDLENLVLVGGESSKKNYPGPSIVETAQLVQEQYNKKIFLGGITIPARINEPARLIQKSEAGIEYFISQVICEADLTKNLLLRYDQSAQIAGLPPKRIFLSFAPIASQLDVAFLRWWDVLIPIETERFLLSKREGILERSITLAENIFKEISGHIRQNQLKVPIGLNIEHLSTRNLEASQELAARLAVLYK